MSLVSIDEARAAFRRGLAIYASAHAAGLPEMVAEMEGQMEKSAILLTSCILTAHLASLAKGAAAP